MYNCRKYYYCYFTLRIHRFESMCLLSKDVIVQATEAEGDRQVAFVVSRHPGAVPRLREEVT